MLAHSLVKEGPRNPDAAACARLRRALLAGVGGLTLAIVASDERPTTDATDGDIGTEMGFSRASGLPVLFELGAYLFPSRPLEDRRNVGQFLERVT